MNSIYDDVYIEGDIDIKGIIRSSSVSLDSSNDTIVTYNEGNKSLGKRVVYVLPRKTIIELEHGDYIQGSNSSGIYFVNYNGVDPVEIYLPSKDSEDIPIGSYYTFYNRGTKSVEFVGDAGVTILSADNYVSTEKQYGVTTIIKTKQDEWLLEGNLI